VRILLAQNSLYYPAHGGGDKSNRILMEALAARGHECRAVARLERFGDAEETRFLSELAVRDVEAGVSNGIVRFERAGVVVHTLANDPHVRQYFMGQVATFHPDIILASTDDPAQVLLEPAVRSPSRVVYLARATIAVPFGPDSAFPSASKTAVLRHTAGIVTVSEYVAAYIRRWSGIEAIHLPISLQDPGPYPNLGRFENEFIVMVNPCGIKGISIFLELARRMPHLRFAAVPTWGTSEADLASLAELPNVTVLPPVDRIDDLLARTKILLVPSLWAEARSRIVVEAMVRGVPVLAANIGGIPEAMLGVDYLLPVRPIEKYLPQVDAHMVPVPVIPEQDVSPWRQALERVASDRSHWEELSVRSRSAALAYVESHGIERFESYLLRLMQLPRSAHKVSTAAPGVAALESLSPEKRRLLALRLPKKSADPWLPNIETAPAAPLRLFCFPYAGGGSAVFRAWQKSLEGVTAVCPIRLPGRETRIGEPPVERLEPVVDAIAAALEPYEREPFAFFGHSMGAAIAFETARFLRAAGRPQPLALLVSGARAPQYRLGHVPPPEPSDADFLAELERLEGIPKEVFESRELMKLILPALRSDARIYRHYIYTPAPPLNMPLCAFCGLADPNIRREQMEAWREQTTSSFSLRMFPGGHFFIHTERAGFLTALRETLAHQADRSPAL
jgi:surfactin synthase thioesterase subunit/glycosyltransferase involved in cell wall biosynthesis